MNSMKFSIAPDKLWQAINPWTFNLQGMKLGFINVDLGTTPRPDIEQAILDDVGSYGRQLGRIGDALEVLMKRVPMDELSKEDRDALLILQGQIAQVRRIKTREA
jgi:hypothetical protein